MRYYFSFPNLERFSLEQLSQGGPAATSGVSTGDMRPKSLDTSPVVCLLSYWPAHVLSRVVGSGLFGRLVMPMFDTYARRLDFLLPLSDCSDEMLFTELEVLRLINKMLCTDWPKSAYLRGVGQGGASQGASSVDCPSHTPDSVPDPGSLTQVRVRNLVPPAPHVTEHSLNSDQQDQWP